MPDQVKRFYCFGNFQIDPCERLLLRDNEPVHLQSKAFDTLLTLVRNSGTLVKKKELLRSVWADSFVEENNLTQNIYALRKALGGPNGTNYIETIPRYGYRFNGEVHEVLEETERSVVQNRSLVHFKLEEKIEEKQSERFLLLTRWPAPVFLTLSVVLIGWFAWQFTPVRNQRASFVVPSDIKTLAVLPFQIDDPANADSFLGLAIADDLSRQINVRNPLKLRFVTPGSRVLEDNRDPQMLGNLLKADAVLTGVVSRDDRSLFVEAKLIRTVDGSTLWTASFNDASGDLYAINDAIAAAFAHSGVTDNKSRDDSRKHRPERIETYKMYLRARALWNKRTGAELHQSTVLLEQTVAKEPSFARAYAALADAYAFDYTQRFKAVETANKALDLDPNLGEAHATLGFVRLFWDWNVLESERHFKRATALSPDYATGHQWYAALFAASNMMSAAKVEILTALDLEPTSLPIHTDAGQMLYYSDEYDNAYEYCSNALRLDPDFINAHACLYQVYTRKGMYPEAVASYFKREELAKIERKNVTDRNGKLKYAFGTGGIEAFWKEQLPPLWEIQGYLVSAEYYARLGNREEALRFLEIAFAKREFGFLFIPVNPVFADYRADARFQRLIAPFNLTVQNTVQ